MTEMERAYQLAAAAVRRRLTEQHPEDLKVLDKIRKNEVSVFSGPGGSRSRTPARRGRRLIRC